MDGSLLSVRGKWKPVNYLDSQLYSEISHDEMFETAFDRLESENANLGSDSEIHLGTVYRSVHDVDCGWILDLKGTVMVTNTDIDGRISDRESYEFDI